MMRRYAALTGRRRLIVKVPVLSPRARLGSTHFGPAARTPLMRRACSEARSSLWLGLVTELPTSVGRPLVDGLTVEVVTGDDRIRSLVPFTLLGYDDAVRLALAPHLQQFEEHRHE
jgi:hypothetical protein